MVALSSTNEIANFQQADQFQPAKSQYECGYFGVMMARSMAQVGQSPTLSVQQIIDQAEKWYAQYDGSDALSNVDGMTTAQEYSLLSQVGLHYQSTQPLWSVCKKWLELGYPLIVAVAETSVFDIALGRVPYPWNPEGNHIILLTGVAPDGNPLTRDSANCTDLHNPNSLRPGPRHYDGARLQMISATVVVPPWMARPVSAVPPESAPTQPKNPQYVDISAFQAPLDWGKYKQWAASFDGVSRVAIKATEGIGFIDHHFMTNRDGALAAGIDMIIYYGYGRPDLGNTPIDEANWLFQTVKDKLRPQDRLMLDMEVVSPADWSYQWLVQQEQNCHGTLPLFYSYDSFVREHLQDARLGKYPPIIAHYTYDVNARPACPPPWINYFAIQFTDKASIPGIAGTVDANVIIQSTPVPTTTPGGNTMPVPSGWTYANNTLTAPNGKTVVLGFCQHILNAPSWDAGNMPQENEYTTSQVLVHNASVGGGTRQCFRDCLMWYTQSKGVVVEPYPGLELKACYDLIASLQAEIATLKVQPAPALEQTNTAMLTAILAQIDQLKSQIDTYITQFQKQISGS